LGIEVRADGERREFGGNGSDGGRDGFWGGAGRGKRR